MTVTLWVQMTKSGYFSMRPRDRSILDPRRGVGSTRRLSPALSRLAAAPRFKINREIMRRLLTVDSNGLTSPATFVNLSRRSNSVLGSERRFHGQILEKSPEGGAAANAFLHFTLTLFNSSYLRGFRVVSSNMLAHVA